MTPPPPHQKHFKQPCPWPASMVTLRRAVCCATSQKMPHAPGLPASIFRLRCRTVMKNVLLVLPPTWSVRIAHCRSAGSVSYAPYVTIIGFGFSGSPKPGDFFFSTSVGGLSASPASIVARYTMSVSLMR